MKKFRIPLRLLILTAIILAAGLFFMVAGGEAPSVAIRTVDALPLKEADQIAPFFELMTPLPHSEKGFLIARLEYLKGPPSRFIDHIQEVWTAQPLAPKERMTFHGRQTGEEMRLHLLRSFVPGHPSTAELVKTAIAWSQAPAPSYLGGLVARSLARQWLAGVTDVVEMEQAGVPAFLFLYQQEPGRPQRARAWFFRRDSRFAIDYQSDRIFLDINPEEFFRKTFLTANRADALNFVQQQLLQVHFPADRAAQLSPTEVQWPLTLLAAHFSLDPTTVDSLYHFAGLSALLFKSKLMPDHELELSDILRSNVLAANLFAKDIAPDSEKTAEIAKLARNILSNLPEE